MTGRTEMRDDEGIMIIGHGSRSEDSEAVFGLQSERLRGMGFKNVYTAFNEMSERTIEGTLQKMADDGIRTVYALPLFIISGLHVTTDISKKLGLTDGSNTGTLSVNGKEMKIMYASAVGRDPLIAAILAEKVRGLMSGVPEDV